MGLIGVIACLLIVLVTAVAQPAVAHYLSVGAVYPDLAVSAVVVAGMFLGSAEGGGMGLLAGLITMSQIGHVGVAGALLARFVAGVLGGVTGARLYRQSPLVQMGAVAAGVLAAEAVQFVLYPDPLIGRWFADALGRAVASGLCGPVIYGLVNRAVILESGERHRYMPLR